MLIFKHNSLHSEIFHLEKNQIAILFTSVEKIPKEIDLDNIKYNQSMAAVIPTEFIDQGFLKGSIFACTQCLIYGIDEASEFKTIFAPQEEITKIAKNIWNNPSKYSEFEDNSEDAYYKFLKFLWIDFPDDQRKRLADIVD